MCHGVERSEINVRPPLKRMLRHGVGCLAERLFERIPPLRAFGPPVGMTAVGDGRPPIIVIPSEAVRRVAQHRAAEESVLQRRAATPLMLLRRGIGRLVGCGMASSAWRSTLTPIGEHVAALRRAPGGEINVRPPLKRMLRHGIGHLVEGLFERIPPLRAFGPPVGMTAKGGL